jgi:hypothetical protein
VTIIQIIRIFSVKRLKTVTDSQGLIVWSVVEVSLGVCLDYHSKVLRTRSQYFLSIQAIITCIPTYGPLFKSFASTISSNRNNGTGPSYPLGSVPEGGARNTKSDLDGNATFRSQHQTTSRAIGPNQKGGLASSHDTGSEEHIFHVENDGMRIFKTVDFTVEKY